MKVDAELPPSYRILPVQVTFRIPGFERQHVPGTRTLALTERDTEKWFHEFVGRIVGAVGQRYLPVCRMSDGEFMFAVGEQPPSTRWPWWERLRLRAMRRIMRLRTRSRFVARTRRGVSSGSYTRAEWRRAREAYGRQIRAISEKGMLALHLTVSERPFQERFFPAVGRWLLDNDVRLTEQNYVPFYFVYAALAGAPRQALLAGRRVLLVHSAKGEKRESIEESIRRIGARQVVWLSISPDRSLFDELDVASYAGEVDIALIGAGVGKPNVLLQLEPLRVPCVDAGFMFEVWADPAVAAERPYCRPDADAETSSSLVSSPDRSRPGEEGR